MPTSRAKLTSDAAANTPSDSRHRGSSCRLVAVSSPWPALITFRSSDSSDGWRDAAQRRPERCSGVPVWKQLAHLALADALWIAYVLVSAHALEAEELVPVTP